MAVYIPSNVLFLSGVFEGDLSTDDSMFDTKFTEGVNAINDDELPTMSSVLQVHYNNIPSIYSLFLLGQMRAHCFHLIRPSTISANCSKPRGGWLSLRDTRSSTWALLSPYHTRTLGGIEPP